MKRIIATIAGFLPVLAFGQLNVLTDNESLVTGTWQESGIFETVTTDAPFEGSSHYKFTYNFTEFWSGFGLNMDDWDNSPNRDFQGYTHLRIAYRGLSPEVNLSLNIKTDLIESNTIAIGGLSASYQVVDIPLQALIAGTQVDLASISEIVISASGPNAAGSGIVYVDELKLVNLVVESGTSQKTWSRFQKLKKGFNFANWLEAYWLMPFNDFPRDTRFTRTIVQEMHDLGFNSLRLPVTFERIAGNTPPFDLDMSARVFDLIDSAIIWAEDFDMPLIITNHHGYELTDANYTSEISRIRKVWEQVRQKYGSLDPEMFFFELSNEPTNSISNQNFHTVADSLIKDFRDEGYDHSLILGGNGYNSAAALLNTVPYADPDIIYTFHSYDPYLFTHQQMSWTDDFLPARTFPINNEEQELKNQIASMKEWSETYNLPVFLGEFGASSSADATSRCNYVSTIADAFFQESMPYFYWDATTNSDAFGFVMNGDAVDCFASAMKLEASNLCNLSVDNLADSGEGSLRNALACAKDGDVITIDKSLINQDIVLDLPSLFIQKNLTITQLGNAATNLKAGGSLVLIEVGASKTLTLNNVTIDQSASGTAPALVVKGEVILEDVTFNKQ